MPVDVNDETAGQDRRFPGEDKYRRVGILQGTYPVEGRFVEGRGMLKTMGLTHRWVI